MAARNLVLLLILCTAVKGVHEGVICPDYELSEWRMKVNKYNCRDGMKYHCAKDDDGVFVEGCATKIECDIGEEPWFVEKNKVQCRSCTDPERFQLVPQWSDEISQCERERYLCPYAIHQILCDTGNTKSPRTCRCDYLNNYVPIVEKDKGCRISNDLHCVLDSPCKEDEERLQSNYSCVPNISFNPDQTRDPFIDSGSVQTTSNTPPSTTTSTSTSTTSTTTEQSKTTTAPADDNGISNIVTSIIVICVYLTQGAIGTLPLLRVEILLKRVERSPNSVWRKIFEQPQNLFNILMCANFLSFIGSLVCLAVMKWKASRRNNDVCSCCYKQKCAIKLSGNEICLLICVSSVSGGIGIAVMMLIWRKKIKEKATEQPSTDLPNDGNSTSNVELALITSGTDPQPGSGEEVHDSSVPVQGTPGTSDDTQRPPSPVPVIPNSTQAVVENRIHRSTDPQPGSDEEVHDSSVPVQGTPDTSNVTPPGGRIQPPEPSYSTLNRSSPQHRPTDPQPGGSGVQVQYSSVPVQGPLYKRVLSNMLIRLIEDLDVARFLDSLVTKDIIKSPKIRDIRELLTTTDKVRDIVELFRQRPHDDYLIFLVCLDDSNQGYLKKELEKEEEKLKSEISGMTRNYHC